MYEIDVDWPRLAARMAKNDDAGRSLSDGFTRSEMRALDRMVERLDAETEELSARAFDREIFALGISFEADR